MPSKDDDLESVLDRAVTAPDTITSEELTRVLEAIGTVPEGDVGAALHSIAEHDPDTIDAMVAGLETVLSDGDEGVRIDAISTLTQLAARYPEQIAPVIPTLVDLLDDRSHQVRHQAAQVVARVADVDPDAAVPVVAALPPLLRDDTGQCRHSAGEIAHKVALSNPTAVAPLAGDLLAVVTERYDSPLEALDGSTDARYIRQVKNQTEFQDRGARLLHDEARGQAAHALTGIARGEPCALLDHVSMLVAVFEADAVDLPIVRKGLLGAFEALARTRPTAIVDAIEPFAVFLQRAEDVDAIARATWVLGLLAEADEEAVADSVVPTLPTVIELLDDGRPQVRAAAAGLLAYVAPRHADEVVPAVPTLVERLDDEHPSVRGSAAIVLGSVGDSDVRGRIVVLRENDPDPTVREAAVRAIEAIDERTEG